MPFRATFDCLWCGATWAVRGSDDLEGFAQLCPTCIGRAGENEFLRFRLKTALAERAAGVLTAGDLAADTVAYADAPADDYDDWYLRRGRYDHGPIHDQAWAAELDQATRWLDGLPIGGEIVELAAGTGWWSPLLAAKGALSIYDAAEAPLDRARERLLAHGLRAHIHVRDAWADPDRQVDALFCGFWLSHVGRERLGQFLQLAAGWLRPGGTFAFIDARPDPQSGPVDRPMASPSDASAVVVRRRLADVRGFPVANANHAPAELEAALLAAGFASAEVTATARFFLLGRATA